MPAVPTCTRCKRKLTKPRIAARKRKCYPCEMAVKREGKQRAHDRQIESEDFTAEDYWQLYREQDGHCAIYTCRAQGKSKHLVVEHDHACEMGHPPNRWCRVCVRGLTCSQHNEWIGRTGDNPEIFDSLAQYLRDPPARETLLGKMVAGTHDEILVTLNKDYKIPLARARKMLDLARGVGPSPTPIAGAHGQVVTIEIRYIRIPRTKKVLYEIIESEPRLERDLALKHLMDGHDLKEQRAKNALNAAWEKGKIRVTTKEETILIKYHGRGANETYMFSIKSRVRL